MAAPPSAAQAGPNLERASLLVLDADPISMAITTQILSGFGAKNIHRCETDQASMQTASSHELDLIIFDASSPSLAACEFVRWVRREESAKNRHAPILVITAYTQLSRVNDARDAGANFVVAKPLMPMMLLQRIQWLTRDRRAHIESPTYVGPDRRFKFQGPPPGTDGRREGDLKGDLGAATEPNMSQADIDALMQPTRVVF